MILLGVAFAFVLVMALVRWVFTPPY